MDEWRQRMNRAVPIGVGATVTMDLGGELIRRATGVAPLDYALLGRWIGHMPACRFRHDNIAAAPSVRGERTLGTIAHYAIGVAFAALLLRTDEGWAEHPTVIPAIAMGLSTTVAPFALMQPAFGMGFAGSKTLAPVTTRLRSVRAHAIYGLGLWASAALLARLSPPDHA